MFHLHASQPQTDLLLLSILQESLFGPGLIDSEQVVDNVAVGPNSNIEPRLSLSPRAGKLSIERVLAIPEILRHIFGNLEPDLNARNACVCKRWCQPALDVAWRHVGPGVFRSLAPVDEGQLSSKIVVRNFSKRLAKSR